MDEATGIREGGDRAVFYGLLNEAVTEFIGDRLNIDTGALTIAGLSKTLTENGVDSVLADKTVKTLELCDFFRFSSSGSDREMQDKLLKDTQSVINELRNIL